MIDAGTGGSARGGSKKIHIPCFPLEVVRTPAFLIDQSLRVMKVNSRGASLLAGKWAPATINDGMLRLGCPEAHAELGSFVDGFFGTDSEDEGRFVKPSMLLRLLRALDKEVALLSVRVASHQLLQVSAARVDVTTGGLALNADMPIGLPEKTSNDFQ